MAIKKQVILRMKNSKKSSLNSFSALVYSTHPESLPQEEPEEIISVAPEYQRLKVSIDRKQRKGKTVTLIEGFEGSDEDLEALAKKLKTRCGVGGNAKDGLIIIQGEMLQKVKDALIEWGYSKTK